MDEGKSPASHRRRSVEEPNHAFIIKKERAISEGLGAHPTAFRPFAAGRDHCWRSPHFGRGIEPARKNLYVRSAFVAPGTPAAKQAVIAQLRDR